MNALPLNLWKDEDLLGDLAMKFRGTKRDEERQAIAREYSQTVDRLIQCGHWDEMPSAEDQLPDGWMPKAFFAYWSKP